MGRTLLSAVSAVSGDDESACQSLGVQVPDQWKGGHRDGGQECPPHIFGRRRFIAGVTGAFLAAGLPLPADEAKSEISSGVFTFEDERKRTLEITARVLVEAQDGGLLLQGTDGRIWTVPPARLQNKVESTTPFKPLTGEELGRQLVQTFKTGYQSFVSEHYVICTNASDAYARWCSGLLERLATAFRAYWKQRGVVTVEPQFPLVALIFQRQTQFADFATKDVGPDVATVPGYFSIPTNRIVLRDLTESTRGQPARTPEEVDQRLGSALSNVATIVHEATHQIAFNCGIHTRLADNPLWLTEGMAIYFETPDLRSKTGWKTAGQLHRHRLQRFKEYLAERRQADALETLIRNDERLTNAETAEDAYAESWALTYFLLRKQAANYITYLKKISAKQPLEPATSEQRVTDTILDDLVAVTKPRSMKIVAAFTPRGGIRTNVIAEYTATT